MLAGVLKSEIAIATSIQIVGVFIRMRQVVISHADLARRLDALESKYDAKFREVFDAIRPLMEPSPPKPRTRIGFGVPREPP